MICPGDLTQRIDSMKCRDDIILGLNSCMVSLKCTLSVRSVGCRFYLHVSSNTSCAEADIPDTVLFHLGHTIIHNQFVH